MASFGYIAVDKNGKEQKGSVEADTKEKALAAVRALGYTPLSVTPQSFLTKDINISLTKGTTVREKSLFCRQFTSLLRAGVTIIDSLGMLAEQTENKGFAKAIKDVQTNIQKGETLGNSMRQLPEYFPSMLVNLVDAGEASGSLDVSLERMAIQFEKDAKLQGMIKKAMIYPIVVCFVAIGVVILMLAYVVPTFMEMFADLDIEMPALTVAVMAASEFVQSHLLLILGIIIALVIGIKYFKDTPRGKAMLGYLGVKIPALANFTVKSSASRLARTLSTLLYAGIPMVEAVEITAHTMTNVLFRDALLEAKEEILKGVPLSEPLKASGLFPPMVVHMTSIGEETGDMEAMLEKMADYYDEEVELATQSMMAALEPMIIVVLAIIVGVLVGAVVMPMLSLYTGLENL
ncbi:MAG: type II secretion system F family protein [Lachnospiraceae bacterium]|nr:type II secretion system F family protein [Lachnospiraceae bacterium]